MNTRQGIWDVWVKTAPREKAGKWANASTEVLQAMVNTDTC